MKASREQLKALMKEIFLEILSEGLPIAVTTQPGMVRPPAPGRPPISGMQAEQRSGGRRRPTFDPRLDSPVGNGRTPTDALKEAITREAHGNPIMADILADTAMTTLPSQLSHGDSMGQPGLGGPMPSRDHMPGQQEQFHGDPAEIFGGGQPREDGSSHWADLAFMGPGKKSA